MLEVHFQGGSIELDEEQESYNKCRARLDKVLKDRIDYENGEYNDDDGKKPYRPVKDLHFFTSDGGRICLNPEKIICFLSDEYKDQPRSQREDEDEDDE